MGWVKKGHLVVDFCVARGMIGKNGTAECQSACSPHPFGRNNSPRTSDWRRPIDVHCPGLTSPCFRTLVFFFLEATTSAL